jgi:hypothetical protein
LKAAGRSVSTFVVDRRWRMSPFRMLRDTVAARWPAPGVDAQILSGHESQGGREVRLRGDYLVSQRYRRAIAGGLRNRPWVRDPRIRATYESLARRLDSQEPITARGMLRLVRLLTTAPSAVAVGCPETVVRELGAITYLLDDWALSDAGLASTTLSGADVRHIGCTQLPA